MRIKMECRIRSAVAFLPSSLLCFLCLFVANFFFVVRTVAGAGAGGVLLRFPLLPLLRGSLPRMTTFREFLDHLLIEGGYIGRLPAGY